MVDRQERLILIIDEKGARVVERRIGKIGKTAKGASKGTGQLVRALKLLAGAAIIRQIGRLADSFTNLQNRIRLVTRTTGELNKVTEELFNVARRTRTPIETNAELFNRLAQSGKDLNLSFQDVLDITESVNKAVIISGASAQEAAGAIRQLTQGLAANALRGQELNSILEQTPRIADIIAKRLGVTRGSLKLLGEQGKITADVIIEAFKDAKTELDEEFGRTVPTLGQSFTVLGNDITEFIGVLDKATGASGTFVSALNNIGITTRFLIALLKDAEGIAEREVKPVFAPAGERVSGIPQREAREEQRQIKQQESFGDFLQDLIRGTEAPSPVRPVFGPEGGRVSGEEVRPVFGAEGQREPGRPGTGRPVFGPQGQRLADEKSILDRALARDNETKALTRGQVAVRDFNRALDDELKISKLGTEERIVAQAELKATNVLRKRGADLSAEETKATIARAGAAAKDNIELEKRQAILDDIKGPEKERLDTLRILSTLRAENAINERQFAEAVAQTNRELQVQQGLIPNVIKVFQDLDVTIEKLGNDIGNILVGSIDSAADALADFAISGFQNTEDLKAAFSDLFASLAKDILKAIIKLILLQAFQALTGTGPAAGAVGGGGAGGTVSAGLSFGGLQAGGPAGRGQPILVGERGPEIFTPTASGNVTPSNQVQPAETKVTVVNVTDPDEIPAAMGSPEGEQVILNVLQRNSETVRRLAT